MQERNEFPIRYQARIVSALCVVHNFIRIHDPDDEPEPYEDGSARVVHEYSVPETRLDISRQESREAALLRDKIASDMWAQYSSRYCRS